MPNHTFDFLDKLFEFTSFYLFKELEKWGTELDWKRLLHHNPDSTSVQNFVKLLISLKILVKNRQVSRNNKNYQTYKLHKNYERKLKDEIIELSPAFQFLKKRYEIYSK